MAQPPQNMTPEAFISAVDHVIRERKTAKLLGDPDNCAAYAPKDPEVFNAAVREAVAIGGHAPFHKIVSDVHRQGETDSPAPWRFYVLEKSACCGLLNFLKEQAQKDEDPKWARAMSTKIPKLLAATGALVMATWLPDPSPMDTPVLNENNIEHIAGAATAVHNLTLAAEARNMMTFWSTGGILQNGDVFEKLGISRNERLLAAMFLAPADEVTIEPVAGEHREKRGQNWMRWISTGDLG